MKEETKNVILEFCEILIRSAHPNLKELTVTQFSQIKPLGCYDH